MISDQGVVTDVSGSADNGFVPALVTALAQHRHWDRAMQSVPA
jgi:hypothetical protein